MKTRVTILSIICIILMLVFGCRTQKETTESYENTETKQYSTEQTNETTTGEIMTNIKSKTFENYNVETITNVVEIDYENVIDPKTGDLKNLPKRQKTTTTTKKNNSEKKSDTNTNINSQISNSITGKHITESNNKKKHNINITEEKDSSVRYVRDSIYLVVIIVLIVLTLRYKSNILTALKCIVKTFKKRI